MGFGFVIKLNAVVLAAFIVADTSALLFSSKPKVDPNSDDLSENWPNLRVTFDTNLITKAFKKLPRNIFDSSTTAAAWTKTLNTECTSGGRYAGYRVIKNNDPSINLIVDKNGITAGIQMNLPQDVISANNTNTYRFRDSPMFTENTIDGVNYWTLTAYWIEPSRICDPGRTAADLEKEGTGTVLYFQNGPTPNDLIHVPRHRDKALTEGWTDNNCFPMMGSHTFYQVEKLQENNCDIGRPVFILWHKRSKEMLGFGFQATGKVVNDNYENPPKLAINAILGTTPDCMNKIADTIGLTTMHVYFVDYPATITCL